MPMDWATKPDPQIVAVKNRKNDCLSSNMFNLKLNKNDWGKTSINRYFEEPVLFCSYEVSK